MDCNENPPGTMSTPERVDDPGTQAASSLEDKMSQHTDGEKASTSTQNETLVDEKPANSATEAEVVCITPVTDKIDSEKPGCSSQRDNLIGSVEPGSSSQRDNLCTKSSMFTMMIDGGDDEESDDELPKELDQAALSRLCVIQGELILREEARAISEITIKMALEEERREIRARRITSSLINSAFSAAVIMTPVKRKKRGLFRRLLECCFMCCRRRGRD
uniref:Uncharacterized protein LOC111129575 n=1 Tax=Crassostrea virginica TaxID=6565 RepID=A0A8B8DVR9_CRAVI|nr:uncharacterized protein LOC111129575 [Crassostrea virginica]